MNTEIVRGLATATCLDPQGNLFVALFKHSLSNNGITDDSTYHCVHFGDYTSAIRYMVLDAVLCESGQIRWADGRTSGVMSAEHYLLAWRVALERPSAMPTLRVIVPASTGIDMKAIAAVLAELGLVQRRAAWLEFDLRIAGNAKALAACIDRRIRTKLQPWLCFSSDLAPTSALEAGTPAPPTPHFRVPSVDIVQARMKNVAVWRVPIGLRSEHGGSKPDPSSARYLLVTPGSVDATGNSVSTMQLFMAGFVLQSELEQPGVSESLIGAFRQRMRQARDLPDHTLVLLQKPRTADKRQRLLYERAVEALNRPGANRVLTSVLEIRDTPDCQDLLEATTDMVVFPELFREAV